MDALSFPMLLHDTHNQIWLFMSDNTEGWVVKNGKLEQTSIKLSSAHPWRPYYGSLTLENFPQ